MIHNMTLIYMCSELVEVTSLVIIFSLETEFIQIGIEPDGVKLYSDTGLEFVGPISSEFFAVGKLVLKF